MQLSEKLTKWRVLAQLGRPAVLWGAAALCACGGEGRGRAAGGTLVVSTAADADYLFPPLVTGTLGRVISDQIFEPLADIGDSLNAIGDRGFVPRLADSWTWSPDSMSIAFHLNPRARWHDGQPVRAEDVRFTYKLNTDPALGSTASTLLANIDSVSVRDSLTPIIWFRHRDQEQFYDAASQMQILPEHVYGKLPARSLGSSDVVRHPVGSGRFKLARWSPGASIELVSNRDHYRAPARLDRVIWMIAPDPAAAAARFLSGAADLFEAIRPDMLPAIQRNAELRLVEFPGFRYGYLAFNLRDPNKPASAHPLFWNVALRRALTMAVDRRAMVQNVFDTLALPSIGPTVRAMPTADTSIKQIPYDTIAARRTLDSLGWKIGSDGIRRRNNVPLAFSIMTPSSSKDRVRLAVLLQDAFKKVGAQVQVQSLDVNAFIAKQSGHGFDTALESWSMVAAPDAIRESWGGSSAQQKSSNNFTGYSSPQFDSEIDSALTAPTLMAARPLFARAFETIISDAPAVWLYEPKNMLGVQRRIHLATLRPDAWWAHLADWYVPANEQIARDRVGLPGPAAPTGSAAPTRNRGN